MAQSGAKRSKAKGVLPWVGHQLNNVGNAPKRAWDALPRVRGVNPAIGAGMVGNALYSPGRVAPPGPGETPNAAQMQDFFGKNPQQMQASQDAWMGANPAFGLEGAGPATGGSAGPDYMSLFNQLMGGGAPPSFSFDSSPYQQAIAQAGQQAQLGRQTIQQSGQDLMKQLGTLRGQWEGRNAEDVAAIQGTQQKALGQAQAGLNPVMADLQAQGVNTAPVAALANQRIGTLGDQASLQNTLSQRLAQNAQNTMSGTERGAAASTSGALNTLAGNLSNAVSGISQQQAKAAAAAQADYFNALKSYNSSRGQQANTALSLMNKLAGGAGSGSLDGDVDAIQSQWAAKTGATADAVNQLFGYLGTDFESVDDIIGDLDTKDREGPDGKPITGWDELAAKGVNVNTVKAALKQATKQPKANSKGLAALLGGQ